PDIADLAKRYVALWQDYLTATAADPDLADALARLITGLGAFASPWLRQAAAAAQRGRRSDMASPTPPHDRRTADPARPAPAAPRPAAAAAPSDGRSDELAQLGRRLAVVEERLAALEAGARQRSAGARSTARRRRS